MTIEGDKIDSTNQILKRILENEGGKNAFDFLTLGLSGSDLQSLLLSVFNERSQALTPGKIIRAYEASRFTQPSGFDQREFLELDNLFYSVVPKDFRAIETSPTLPFGSSQVLAKADPKNVLTTIRNLEVVSDSTVALSLECARERKKDPLSTVKVCSSGRVVRAQQYEEGSGFTPHFRVFSMCTAGRDTGHELFEKTSILEHLSIYLKALSRYTELGFSINDITVSISDIRITEEAIKRNGVQRKGLGKIIREGDLRELFGKLDLPVNTEFLSKVGGSVFKNLEKEFPTVSFNFQLDRLGGIGHYNSLCFRIDAKNRSGETYQLVDGGLTDWTQSLLSNKKERLLISGIGTEFLLRKFK